MANAVARKPSAAPIESSKSSRRVILDSACRLMTARSSIDITIAEITNECGLSSALVKYYFGDKQGMMLAILDDVLGRGLDKLEELVEMDMSPTEKIKLHISAIISVYFRYPFINRLIHQLMADPLAGPKVAEKISKPLASTQRTLLEQGIAAGEFKPVNPMMFYFIVLGACDHLFFGQYIMRVAFDIDAIDDDTRRIYTRTLLDIVLNGILQR